MAFQVSLNQAKEMVEDCLRVNLVPMLLGSPGCGKSAIIKQIAKEFNLKLIDLRLATAEPTDLLGFPRIDEERNKAGYVPMDTFPLESDPIPDGYEGWLLFLDEMNSADKDLQKAAYKLIYDREVGSQKLHSKCRIVGAGNLLTDNAIVEELSTALQSRLIHIEVVLNWEEWLAWADENQLDHRVRAFTRFKQGELLFKFDPDHNDKTFACPRTWDFASTLIKGTGKLTFTKQGLLCGTLSEGVGREFAGFCEIYEQLPTLDSIAANPEHHPMPDEPSIQYALTGMIGANAKPHNIDGLIKFVRRMNVEFQVVTLRDCIRRDKTMAEQPAMKAWVKENATELF